MVLCRWRLRLCGLLVLLAVGLAAGPSATAGSFQVDPVGLEITPGRTSTSLSIANRANGAVSVRVVAKLWTQQDGKDVYADTANVIVSPPIFTLPPGRTQLVRVGLRSRQSGEAYRIVVEEIPSEDPAAGIHVALRLDLPLFVEPEHARPDVRWQVWRSAAGELSLVGENAGLAHFRVRGIELDGPRAGDRIRTREMGVVLPSSSRRWNLGLQPSIDPGSALTLKIRTPAGEVQHKVVVQQL